MSIRSSTLYVEPKTVRRLLLVVKLYPERVTDIGSGMAPREKTADERGDALINEAINVKFPKVIELERLLTKTEKDFMEVERVKNNLLAEVEQQIMKGTE
jgi:hypothetical protein